VPDTPHGDVTGTTFEVAPLEGEAINVRNSVITVNPLVNLLNVIAPFLRGTRMNKTRVCRPGIDRS
jgi:hypothetical protein